MIPDTHRHERDGRVSARLMALANALEDIPREETAWLAGMTGQTLADWVHLCVIGVGSGYVQKVVTPVLRIRKSIYANVLDLLP